MKKLIVLSFFSLLFAYSFAQESVTAAEVKAWIIEHSKEGGTIDFFTSIKGIENELIQTGTGEFTTNKGLALVNWGTALKEAGVLSAKDALAIYKLIKKADLDEAEIKNITKGFL
ncbi:MAG: hypothetical protein JKY42_00650 [Flavobacteriales bacterium]|nr:hypothetical protein [Flavobacteriales bacterium]